MKTKPEPKFERIRYSPDETGWAASLGGNVYQIANVPMSAGLNIDDVVKQRANGTLRVISNTYDGKCVVYYQTVDQYRAFKASVETRQRAKCEGIVLGMAAVAYNSRRCNIRAAAKKHGVTIRED